MVAFETLPDDARVWVFAADSALAPEQSKRLLNEVDAFLAQWNAHGMPLRCARDWREDRFLAVGVDQSTAGASGCSIDGLFRLLKTMAPSLGASLLSGGAVYWRDADGIVRSGTRTEFARQAVSGLVTGTTGVFDTSVTTARGWRADFETRASRSWHSSLLGASSAGTN